MGRRLFPVKLTGQQAGMAARSTTFDLLNAVPDPEGWQLVWQAARDLGRCATGGRVSLRRHAGENGLMGCLMESGPDVAITGQMLIYGAAGLVCFVLFYRQFDWGS